MHGMCILVSLMKFNTVFLLIICFEAWLWFKSLYKLTEKLIFNIKTDINSEASNCLHMYFILEQLLNASAVLLKITVLLLKNV